MTDVTTTGERMLFLHDADVTDQPAAGIRQLSDALGLDLDLPRHPGFGAPLEGEALEWDSVADLAQHHLLRLDGHAEAYDDARHLHLAGAGFGGWIALEMAVRARHRFASLTLVAPYGVKLFGPTDREFADILLLDPAETVELGWADPAACHGLRMPGLPAGLEDREYEEAFAERAALSRFVWKPFLHDPRLRRWLHVLTMPALVVAGSMDRMVTPEHSRALAELIPSARYAEIPGSGHYPYLESPRAFADVVTAFVSEHLKTGEER
ncbi:alpha/beta hydrolase [Streptomyces sp. HNM0575]|uniref:alpha/beta fold hydrolase n=1 Tax=Streptomyces sp. HNM0575 TaxID=2716338 RepID=UPI00145D1747|nr:alpha/beta fold hydrolase [Streptomyces sp. HNM0575]NLU72685.1 alpha/beta hydrolase [Streptomyces sp. HNM0575]